MRFAGLLSFRLITSHYHESWHYLAPVPYLWSPGCFVLMKSDPQQDFLSAGLTLTGGQILIFFMKSVQDPILVQIAGDPVVRGGLAGQGAQEN